MMKKTDWTAEETEAATGGAGGETTTHLWEESWDDDDTSDDFSTQLKYVALPSTGYNISMWLGWVKLTRLSVQRRAEEGRGIEEEVDVYTRLLGVMVQVIRKQRARRRANSYGCFPTMGIGRDNSGGRGSLCDMVIDRRNQEERHYWANNWAGRV
jgi:hypothetical protein